MNDENSREREQQVTENNGTGEINEATKAIGAKVTGDAIETWESKYTQFSMACGTLGNMYDDRKEHSKYKNRILELYKLASDHGNHTGTYNYASYCLYITYMYDEAIEFGKLYTKLVPNDKDGYALVAEAYRRKGDDKDNEMDYLEKAFELGEYNIFWKFKNVYENSNPERLNEIYEIAYQNREHIKCFNLCTLGLAFSEGNAACPKNQERALELYQCALKKDDNYAAALYNIGLAYRLGEGVDRDHQIAFSHFQRAANTGDTDGLRELAEYYEYGLGGVVKKDIEKAKELYKQAAEPKYNSSAYACKKMYKFAETEEEKEKYLLKTIGRYEVTKIEPAPKSIEVPFGILAKWRCKLEYTIPLLENKIEKLELEPPVEGGRLYQEAKKRFEDNIGKLSTLK